MEMKIKKKKKKRKWDWLLDVFDVFEILAQILWWILRGIFHLVIKIFE